MEGHNTCENTAFVSAFESIPNELEYEIFARAAASSVTDMANLKLSCKMFKEIMEHPYIYQRVSVEKFQLLERKPKSENEKFFWSRCWDCRNAQLWYKKGVVDFFSSKNESSSALGLLNDSAAAGHMSAIYTIGVIDLFRGGDHTQNGITRLSQLKKGMVSKRDIKLLREDLMQILRTVWIRNSSVLRTPPAICVEGHKKASNSTWDDDYEDDVTCNGCICDREVKFVRKVLPRSDPLD